jgi:antitoxin ParD1/3/4
VLISYRISLLESIRKNQKLKAEKHLETLLLEGLESGQPIEVTPEYLEARRKALRERLEKGK